MTGGGQGARDAGRVIVMEMEMEMVMVMVMVTAKMTRATPPACLTSD
jgi:hypothetical protein